MVHVTGAHDSTTDALKIAGSAMQNDFQCSRRAITSRLVERAKEKTVRKSKSLQLSVSTVMAMMARYLIAFQGSALFT